MIRRHFLEALMAAGGAGAQASGARPEEIIVERPVSGTPHRARCSRSSRRTSTTAPSSPVAPSPNCCAKATQGYFIRTSNDEKDSFELTLGETVLANERDTQ